MMSSWPRFGPKSLPAAIGTLIALGAAGKVTAQEFCVACEGPTAIYRCVLEGIGPAQTQPLKIVCVSTMAREFGHATCSVRGGTVLDCNGPIKRVNAQGKAPLGPDGNPQQTTVLPDAPKVAPQPENEPPKTVEEMARRMNKSTGETAKKTGNAVGDAFKKTGDAIGGAMQKTWTCMTSLFKAC